MIPAIAIGGAGEVLEEHDDGAQQAAGQGGGHGPAKRPLRRAMNLRGKKLDRRLVHIEERVVNLSHKQLATA